MKFRYQAEKFADARRALMLPHTHGEHKSIANAFHDCELALDQVAKDHLDDNARLWIQTLEEFMNTSGLSDPHGVGLWSVKAQEFSVDEKLTISRIVDELAHWFRSRSLP
jgi:hypothetical protein